MVPIFADFASHAAKLIIEVDGDSHGLTGAVARDQVREKFIEVEGYTLVRISNLDGLNILSGVGERLMVVLALAPFRLG